MLLKFAIDEGCDRQQHDCDRDLPADQNPRPRRRRPRAGPSLAFIAEVKSVRPARSAGASPKSAALTPRRQG